MKRLALLVSFVVLLVAANSTTVEAYYLDTPHNESNGIYCHTCHEMPEMMDPAIDWPGRARINPDDTLKNFVCNSCHAENPVNFFKKGPAKKAHASSSTGSTAPWTTECTQCHDVHYQGQLDWSKDDFAKLYLVTGVFNTFNGALTYTDLAHSDVGFDYTTIGFDPDPALLKAQAGFEDASTWKAKGGAAGIANMDPSRAVDGSRGLIMVPDKINHAETFEITNVTGNVITVKGKMVRDAVNGGAFAIIYGQALRSMVMPNGGAVAADLRDVKFFWPKVGVGTSGGYIDNSGSLEPQGLCQVCHDSTAYWKNDGSNTSHNPGTVCGDCHNILQGLGGGTNHRNFIGDFLGTGCGNCHTAQVAAPESGHSGGCNTCHVNPKPAITSNVLIRDGGLSVRNALSSGGYSFGPRLSDSTGKGIAISGFQVVDCSVCHKLKRDVVLGKLAASHGGHGAATFGWDSNCADCHVPTGIGVEKDLHNSSCSLCHDPARVDVGDYTKRIVGNSSNGIDGSAVGATRQSTCSNCHSTNIGTVHHVSKNSLAASSCTTGNATGPCHSATNHQGNHNNFVADYVNCTNCHVANAGSSSGAPIDPLDNKKHDGCTACHNVNTTLKSLAQVSAARVVAMPDGGGNCANCHGEYFASHSNVDHQARVGGNVACNSCHSATVGTAVTAPVNLADNKIHDSCATCHLATGVLLGGYGQATSMVPPGGDCATCHGSYFPSHKINHETRVAGTANCTGCHTGTAGLPGDMPVNASDNKVHDGCSTCHDADTNNLLRVAYGKASIMPPGGGNCNACHGAYFVLHGNANHTTKVAMNANCVGCHDGTQGKDTEMPVNPLNNMVHDACTTCHDGITGALVSLAIGHGGGADCLTCHGSNGHDTNLDHNHRVSSFCSDCHATTDATAIDTLHTSCQTCHAYSGSRLDQATVAAVIVAGMDDNNQSCENCHTINLHHATREAANNNCTTTCHLAVDHGAQVASNSACVSCHPNTAGSAKGISVSLADAAIHDACRTCHAFDAQWRGTLVSFTNLKGVNGSGVLPSGGGNCTVCHTVATATPTSATMATFHHTSPRTGVGQCETCHSDPRPNWQPLAPGDNGTASGLNRPTQMACRKCHVAFTGTSMMVTKFTRSQYQNYKTDWIRTTAHTIPVSTGRINNYGICLSCHYQGSAKVPASAQLSVWHANPSRFGGSNWTFYDQLWNDKAGKTSMRASTSAANANGDAAHYVPGRSKMLASNTAPQSGIAGFNIFSANYGNAARDSYRAQGLDEVSFTGPAFDTPAFVRKALQGVSKIGNPASATLTATTRAVPVFASLSPLSSAPPTSDNIMVKSATHSDGVVRVRASTSNNGGCATMTSTYGSTSVSMECEDSGCMTGANCTATIANPAYPGGGSTVNVSTSNSLGLNVFGYPVVAANPGALVFSVPTYSVSETGGMATITVQRVLGSTGVVSVNYATTTGGTATADSDYTTASGTLSWEDGDTTDKTFSTSIGNDATAEGNETVNLILFAPSGGAILGNQNTAKLTIVDDENSVGTIAFSAPAYSVAENGGTVSITASRTGGSIGAVSVNYAPYTIGNTAVVDSDYPAFAGTLTWADGETGNKSFTITTINHGEVRGNRTVKLFISNVSGGATLGAQNTAVLTIDSPAVAVLDPWTATPKLTGTTGNMSANYSISTGPDRLLLVAISCQAAGGQTGQTFTVMYGGKALTQVALQNSRSRQSWIGYLKEADIAAKTGITINVTINGIHTNAAAFVASYINVNQTSPIGASSGNEWGGGGWVNGVSYSSASSTPVGVGAGGYGIYHWTGGLNATLTRTSDDAAYTEHADCPLSTSYIGVASRPFASAASSNPKITWALTGTDGGAAIQSITVNAAASPVNLAFSAPAYSVNENGVTANISVIRLGKASGAVSVAYATSNGTALAGTDYTSASGTFSWADKDMTARVFTIPISDNPDFATDKKVNLALSSPTGGAVLGVPSTAVLTINSDEAAIAFSSPTYSVNENGGMATITATRIGGFLHAAGVSYATVSGGTAVEGTGGDFTGVSGDLNWPAGDNNAQTFTVPIIDNATLNGSKTVNLALSAPTGPGTVLTSPTTAVLTINENEPSFSFSYVPPSVKENATSGNFWFSVKREGAYAGSVSVDYSTSDSTATAGEDYTATSGTLNWLGADMSSKYIYIPITNDSVPENNEMLNITLLNPGGGALLGSPSSAQVTIIDNDNPGTITFSAPTYTVDENGPSRMANVTVSRLGGADGAVGVSCGGATGANPLATLNTDYSFNSATISWADGDSTDKTCAIRIIPDNTWEGDETANLTLTLPTGGAVLGNQSTAVLTIADHQDWPGAFALSSPTYTVDEDGGSATITVTRSGGYNGQVSVRCYTPTGGTANSPADYNYTLADLVWLDGDTASKAFTIPIINNAVTGPSSKSVNLLLSQINYGGGAFGSTKTAVLSIVDDEGKNGTISLSAPTYSVTEGGTVTITATRSGGSAGAASVDYATTIGGTATEGDDYIPVSGTLNWATGESGSRTFTVPILTDAPVEGDEVFNIILANPTGATLGTATATVIIEGPAVAVLDPWPATPQLTYAGSVNFSIGSGNNRLLLVAISAAGDGYTPTTGQTFSATYGGKPLTQAALQNTNASAQTWIGYLTEADIVGRSGDTLSVSSNGVSGGVTAYIASYSNVNQNSPVAASGGTYSQNGGSFITPSPLPVGAGGYGIFNWANRQSYGMSSTPVIGEGYVLDSYLTYRTSGIASKSFPTATQTRPFVSASPYYAVSFSLVTLNKYGPACDGGACQSPTLTSPTVTTIGSTTATLGGNLTGDGGAKITSRTTLWGTSPNPIGNALAEGGTATGTFSQERSGLPAGTKIYYRASATNIAGIGYSSDGSFYTEPSTQASVVRFPAIDYTSMTISWNRGNGDGVIVLMREGLAVNADPVDGTYTSYVGNSAFGSSAPIGSDNYIVYKGTGSSVTVTGLTLGKTYYVALYEYKGTTDTSGVEQGTNYNQVALTTSQSTSPEVAPSLISPTATAIGSSVVTIGAEITADGGTAITARGTVWGTSPAPTSNAVAEGGSSTGIFSQTRTDLPTGTKIYYGGYAANSALTGYSPGGSFYTEPGLQATGVSFSAVGVATMTVSWVRGDGDGVIVVMKQGAVVDADPVDGIYTTYSGNPLFGYGTQIVPGNSGNYVVYKGTGNSVTVSGLTPGASYSVAIYEYKGLVNTSGTDQGANYKSLPAAGSQDTIANVTPSQPVNLSPAHNATWVTRLPQLLASPFADGDVADTHLASQWLVSTGTGATFDAGIVYNSNEVTGDSSLTLTASLALNTCYYWKVRYQDSKGVWSSYSAESSFTTTSLLTAYRLEEASGTLVADSAGGNTGTLSDGGTSAWGAGFVGNGLLCDGNDRLTWGYAEGRLKNNFSLEAMVKTSADHEVEVQSSSATGGTAGQKYVFGANFYGTPDSGMGVSVGMNGISVYEHSGGYMPPLAVYSGTLGTGWNHIVVTYTNKQPRIYLNGNLVSTGLTSARTNVWISDSVCSDSSAYGYFSGSVDEVQLYGAPLSAPEVHARCEALKGVGQCP